MGKNYHIDLNPKEPSREAIQRHQNFDALLQEFESRRKGKPGGGRIRRLWGYAAASAAAVAALLMFFFLQPDPAVNYQKQANAYFEAQEFVQPPLPEAAPQFASVQVKAEQGGIYEYPSGSRLVVPRSAFMNDRGQLVEGEVSLHYREMHDYIDFFLSGIPMVYDSAGIRYHLESAGMIEIYAEQDGRRVQMAPGKYIDVELVSYIQVPNLNVPPSYNIYQLDTAARNWVYHDIDRIQIIEDETMDPDDPLTPFRQELAETLSAIEAEADAGLQDFERSFPRPQAPLQPRRSEAGRPTLELDLSDEQVVFADGAEASVSRLQETFGSVIWQVSPASPSYDERAFRVNWEQVRLTKLNDWEYELNLIHGDNAVRLLVNPVLSSADYEEARRLYENAREYYQQGLADWEQRRAEREAELQAEARQRRAKAQERFAGQVNRLNLSPLETQAAVATRKVINRFQADDFGIWNCARPLPPSMAQVEATFVDPQGNTYKDCTAYLVDRSRNTVYRFLAMKSAPIHFDTNSENLLWIVGKDRQLAVLRPEAFKSLDPAEDRLTFTLQPVDQPIGSEEDVRAVLEF